MSINDIDQQLSELVQRKHRTTLRATRDDIDKKIDRLLAQRSEMASS